MVVQMDQQLLAQVEEQHHILIYGIMVNLIAIFLLYQQGIIMSWLQMQMDVVLIQ